MRTTLFWVFAALGIVGCGSAHQRSSRPVGVTGVDIASVAPRPFPSPRRGAACPRTPGHHATGHEQVVTLGSGPVYVIPGFSTAPPAAAGVVDYDAGGRGDRRRGGFWENKMLFFRSPSYVGPITIEGRQLDGRHPVDWLIENGVRVRSLSFPEQGEWFPTSALLQAAGCYALRLDGRSFSDVVVFRAVGDATFRRLAKLPPPRM